MPPALLAEPAVPRARVLNPRPAPPPAARILVIRLGALGDVVRTRFAFAGLRELYPAARIEWLVEDRAAPGLAGIRGLDEIVRLPRAALRVTRPLALLRGLREVVADLRERAYDLSVDFHGIAKSALLARAARIPVRAGLAAPLGREGSALWLTDAAQVDRAHLSRFERNAALVRFLGGEVPSRVPPLDLPGESAIDPGLDSYWVVHPGTSESTLYKRWPASRWAEVCQRLADKAGGRALVTWGPVAGERESAEQVVEAARDAAVLAPATPSIESLLGLLGGARLFLGSDSGPMHLAALAGTPIVVVFGPTDPVENAPFDGVPARVVREDVGCNPCREGCPARSCMAAVEAERVVAAALELL